MRRCIQEIFNEKVKHRQIKKERIEQEEATKAALIRDYDDIKARIKADRILAARLQEEEREHFTVEQRAKFLHDTIAAQRRFLAQQRSADVRSRPPTKNQLKNQMMTYLKHVGNFKHADLSRKKFEEIQTLYERQKKFNQSFIPIDSAEDERQIREMNKKAAETDTSKKRKLGSRAKRMSKRQKTDSDVEEKEKLKSFLNLKSDEDKAINYEVLQTRFQIVDWESKFYGYGHYGRELIYYRFIRADESSRWIKTFSEMIKLFDRMDIVEIHSLVMKRFAKTIPEGIDLLLWGDLRTMFESKADDELWKNQEKLNLQSWEFHENCRVHVLRLEGVITDDDTVFDLLRFIEKQIAELEKFEVHKQMACGKDFSNLFMVDNLPKIIWFSTHLASQFSIHLVVYNEELAILEQTATGKGTSNPLMAGSLPKTIKPT
ncbi:hypothetical protein Tco_1171077 [Tanacetum coccineum]